MHIVENLSDARSVLLFAYPVNQIYRKNEYLNMFKSNAKGDLTRCVIAADFGVRANKSAFSTIYSFAVAKSGEKSC